VGYRIEATVDVVDEQEALRWLSCARTVLMPAHDPPTNPYAQALMAARAAVVELWQRREEAGVSATVIVFETRKLLADLGYLERVERLVSQAARGIERSLT
jgi:hypothetical protein